MLASFAVTRKASARMTRPRYSQRYGSSRRITPSSSWSALVPPCVMGARVCIAGVAHPGEERERLREILITNLGFAAREFKAAGLGLLVEPLNDIDVPGFLVPRAHDVVAVLDAVGADNAALQFDIYHNAMME